MPISDTAPDQRIWVTRNNGGAGFTRLDRDNNDTATDQMDVYVNTPGIIHPNDIVFDTVHGLYFFADSVNGNRRILQGNISDLQNPSGSPALTVLYSDTSPGTAGGQIMGLAIDVDASTGQGALYFVNKGNLDRVVYDHDGTSPTNQTPAILAQLPAGSFANEIALDLAHHQAFILSTASTTTPTEVPEGTPGAMFDDDAGVWFINATDVTNNEIWKVSGLDRTDSTTADTSISRLNWVGGDNGGQDLQDSKGLLQSIDVDPTTGMLYFTTQQINSGAFGEVGGIYRYNLSTGTYETLYTEGNSTDYSFEYIHVDPATGRYYVSNASFDDNTNADTSSIFVHDLSPGTPTLFANVGNAGGAVPQGLTVVDAPTLNGTETGATTTESAGSGSGQSSAAFALASLDAHDSDSAGQVDQLAGAQVRISSGFGSSPGSTELLTINGTTSGVLDFGDQDIAYSYNSATGVMILTGASTFADYDAALGLVAYSISGDNPDNFGAAPTRTLAYSVFDGMLYSDEFDATVHIQATDDAPVNGTGGPVATSEDAASVAIAGLSVSDVDSGALTVTLSVGRGTLAIDTERRWRPQRRRGERQRHRHGHDHREPGRDQCDLRGRDGRCLHPDAQFQRRRHVDHDHERRLAPGCRHGPDQRRRGQRCTDCGRRRHRKRRADRRGPAERDGPDRVQPVRRPIFGRDRPSARRLLGRRLRRRRGHRQRLRRRRPVAIL